MATITNQPNQRLGHWLQLRTHLGRLLRNNTLRAIVGAHIIAAAVLLVRGQGWLQPLELATYDFLRVVSAGAATSDRVLLVGAAEDDITTGEAKAGRRWGWPL